MVEFNHLVKRDIDRRVRRSLLDQIRHRLDVRFPQAAPVCFAEIAQITNVDVLKLIEHNIYHLETAKELRNSYRHLL